MSTNSIHLFVHDSHFTVSNDDSNTFTFDHEEIFPLYYIHSDNINIFKFSTILDYKHIIIINSVDNYLEFSVPAVDPDAPKPTGSVIAPVVGEQLIVSLLFMNTFIYSSYHTHYT